MAEEEGEADKNEKDEKVAQGREDRLYTVSGGYGLITTYIYSVFRIPEHYTHSFFFFSSYT